MLQHLGVSLSTLQLIAAGFAIVLVYKIGTTLAYNVKLRKLGGRAPIRNSYAPLGLDLLYELITHSIKDQNYELWRKMFAKARPGMWTLEAGIGRRVILTAEPENIKAVLATQFKEYGKGEKFHKEWFNFLGNGIFGVDGHLWHNSRQLIRPQFIKDRLSDLDIFEEHVQILIENLSEASEVDMLDMFFKYTLDAATHFLLGTSVDSQRQAQTEFADAFYNVQRVQSYIARMGPLNWALPRRLMGFYDSLKVLNAFVNVYIEKALALSPKELEEKTNHDEGYTFLHSIASYTRDRQELRDQIVSILLAGRDTTACTLNWTIYELSLQPEIVAKLRQEIIERVGLERTPTYQNLKDMKYLQNVMQETLRLYPVVPYNIRVSLQDTTLPIGGGRDGTQPIAIPEGTPIGYSPLVMQRREDLYPSEASGFPPVAKFVPERWYNWTPKNWQYIPFNGGPRICIGQQFALTEMGYTLVRLLQRFETIENRMGGVPAGMHADIVLQPSNQVRIAFR
ncbi:cytochrome P450 alkane hydroxylase-like protein [Byssothecium circinans]|uniref:Cytochrome P450 alkane hydroxylase-like protein n=1 Tax=Byssothecium circinans TaxID=147558 RepID=A0A6A5UG65_9PLEO|nr:cytochrome P450 alkane hydroxylase-like protein [Byssothecium circinans]